MNLNKFEFNIFNAGGEYFVKKLANSSLSIGPSFFKIKESDLERVFGINEEKKTYIPQINGFRSFTQNNKMPLFLPVHFGDKLHNLDDFSQVIAFLTNMQQILTKKESDPSINSDVQKTSALNTTTTGLDSFVYRKVEYILKRMMECCNEHPDNALWEFSISGFRKFTGLNKGTEVKIKEFFRKIGVHLDNHRTKFECLLTQKQTHAIRYYISAGELRSIYDPFYEKIELTTAI